MYIPLRIVHLAVVFLSGEESLPLPVEKQLPACSAAT
jgi:hypothetical protein